MGLHLIDTEKERLASLRALQLLDTPPSAMFDRITKLASVLFDSAISVISLVDHDRQWFLSRVGMGSKQTRREYA
ncbi:MAG: sensor domain-containing phosphodiesterase, partial [Erythrobacter sp.]